MDAAAGVAGGIESVVAAGGQVADVDVEAALQEDRTHVLCNPIITLYDIKGKKEQTAEITDYF